MCLLMRMAVLSIGLGGVVLTGCYDRRPTTYTTTLTNVEVVPANPTSKTPVAIQFRVGYKLATGHTNIIMRELVVVAERPGVPLVVKEFRLPVGGPLEMGKIELGELPVGKHVIVVSVRPKTDSASWTNTPSHTVTIEVQDAGGPIAK